MQAKLRDIIPVYHFLKVNNRSPVAQSVERLPVKEDVVGSSPTGGAKFFYKVDQLKMTIPSLKLAIEAVAEYKEAHSSELLTVDIRVLSEISRRLERMGLQLSKLLEINDRLEFKCGIKVDFDQENDIIQFSFGDEKQQIKLNRADPNVPITMDNLTLGGAYEAGSENPIDDEESALRFELESQLESYYQSAHRVLKLFGRTFRLNGIKCKTVSRIRNELIEHSGNGQRYTFGVGSTGPRVKPMYEGAQVFNDEGLLPNTLEFVNAIVEGCRKNA